MDKYTQWKRRLDNQKYYKNTDYLFKTIPIKPIFAWTFQHKLVFSTR